MEEENMMEDIIAEADLKRQKQELDNKMNDAIARRQKILDRRSKKAKHLATRETSDDTAPAATKTDSVDAATIDVPTCSTVSRGSLTWYSPFPHPFPNKPLFLRVCSINLLKTLWEMEKLLVTINVSFSHSVFYSFRELYDFFHQFEIVICKLLQFVRV